MVDAPLARSATNRKKIAIVGEGRGKRAVTHYRTVEPLAGATLVLREQGRLLRLQACTPGGQRWSRTWWPDTLSIPDRRRLRLAASVSPRSGIHLPSMAA